jgi:hypothetical protein
MTAYVNNDGILAHLRIVVDEYRQARLRASCRADLRAAPHPSRRASSGGAMTTSSVVARVNPT